MRLSRLGAAATSAALSLFVLGASAVRCADDTPKDVYFKFHQALIKAATTDAIKPFMSKEIRSSMTAQSKEDAAGTLKVMQKMIPAVLHVDSEKITGNEADLKLSGVLAPPLTQGTHHRNALNATGLISMVREAGDWRIKHQDWNAATDKYTPPAK